MSAEYGAGMLLMFDGTVSCYIDIAVDMWAEQNTVEITTCFLLKVRYVLSIIDYLYTRHILTQLCLRSYRVRCMSHVPSVTL
jgi:hypothetical protein